MMLLIYAHTISPRLLYTVDFFCTDLYGIPYRCTDRPEDLAAYPGPAICYHATNLSPSAFHIVPVDLLFESDIRPQTIDCFMFNGQQAFWGTTGGDWPFDIWAATFYLISRYEEYLPYQTDEYGRYSHTNSLSFQKGFLHLPLVEMWARNMREAIQQKYPNLIFAQRSFRFLPTYDIDLAWSYRHKGWWRNLGGSLRRPGSIGPRLAVLLGQQPDPFDSYGWLHQLHQTYRWQPIYFFLVAAQNGPYDKNILPDQPALQQLIQDHANHYPIGLHPSWQSTDAPALLDSEKQVLEKIAGQSVIHSRQHYIRFHLPVGYRWLLQTGITNDYSMGYGSINGYRASVAQPFNWFDLAHNQSTHLRVHPFCFMDANSFYEQRLTPQQATEELQRYITVCKALNTRLCTIWHNNFLGSDPLYRGWRQVYESLAQSL